MWQWFRNHKGLVLSLAALVLLAFLAIDQARLKPHHDRPAKPVSPNLAMFPAPEMLPEETAAPAPELKLPQFCVALPGSMKPEERLSQTTSCPFISGKSRPQIAIVIDDMGLDERQTKNAMDLPPAVTFAFVPYTPRIQTYVNRALEDGHDIFLHMPMEAEGGMIAGKGELRRDMDDATLRARILKNLESFYGYSGVNNHMGSAFTADVRGMKIFMDVMREQGLMFLDSRTTRFTVAEDLARSAGVPVMRRHIFLDNDVNEKGIAREFDNLLIFARQHGYAVAIGHPHAITLDFLKRNLPYLQRDFDLVSVRYLIEYTSGS